MSVHSERMRVLLESAKLLENEVPVCAAVYGEFEMIETACNKVEAEANPIRHAESVVIEKINSRNIKDLSKMTLYCILEPCVMCTAIVKEAGIAQIVFGATNLKTGGCGGLYDLARDTRLGRWVEVIPNVLEADCKALLESFFHDLRSD